LPVKSNHADLYELACNKLTSIKVLNISFSNTGPMTSQPSTREFTADLGASTRRNRRRLAGYLLIAAFVTAGLASCAYYFLRPPLLEAVHPRIGPAITAVYASGTVEPTVMLPVAPRVGGRLVTLLADENDAVKKGQVLARLESDDLAGNVDQLKANAAFAKSDMDRYTRLMEQNAVARQAYEHAVTTWQMAEAAIRQAEAQAAFMMLPAPDGCTVIKRDGEIGQYIPPNTPIFWLSCQGGLRITAQVDEEDLPMVRIGQKVLIRADAFPGKTFEAEVREVTPKGDSNGRSYRVRINLPTGSPLQIGMTTEANIIVSVHDNAVLLPSSAVVNGKVVKTAGAEALSVPVTTGAKSGDWVEILKGVASNDTVLRDGASTPRGRFRTRLVKP
jgi:RND family efflux transporter MFP subunit